jgi:hypothetical protein
MSEVVGPVAGACSRLFPTFQCGADDGGVLAELCAFERQVLLSSCTRVRWPDSTVDGPRPWPAIADPVGACNLPLTCTYAM